jgi:hypothetical protein
MVDIPIISHQQISILVDSLSISIHIFSANNADLHDITEMFLKAVLNTIIPQRDNNAVRVTN